MKGHAATKIDNVVRIVVGDYWADVPAAAREVVAQVLSPRSVLSKLDSDLGAVCLHRRGRNGGLRVRPGLVPRICVALKTAGVEFEVVDRRTFARLDNIHADVHSLSLPTFLEDVLKAAAESPRGAIAIRKLSNLGDVILGLVRLFSQGRILIVARNRNEAQRLAKQLQRDSDVSVTTRANDQWREGPLVHMDTTQSFIGRSVFDWDVVIVADLESARSKTVIEQVECMAKSRVYAIVPAGARLDMEDQLRLETLCGPEIYRERDDASVLTAVEVGWLDGATYPSLRTNDPLNRKQTFFWNNPGRDQSIVQTAHAIRTLDQEALRRTDLLCAELVQSALRNNSLPSVCVLVETLYHGLNLQKALSQWPVLSRWDFTSGTPDLPLMQDQAIVTIPRAFHQGLGFDVIIRAAGTEQDWKASYGPHVAISGPQMLVVDVRDDVDQRARQDRQRRQQDYDQRGWLNSAAQA